MHAKHILFFGGPSEQAVGAPLNSFVSCLSFIYYFQRFFCFSLYSGSGVSRRKRHARFFQSMQLVVHITTLQAKHRSRSAWILNGKLFRLITVFHWAHTGGRPVCCWASKHVGRLRNLSKALGTWNANQVLEVQRTVTYCDQVQVQNLGENRIGIKVFNYH